MFVHHKTVKKAEPSLLKLCKKSSKSLGRDPPPPNILTSCSAATLLEIHHLKQINGLPDLYEWSVHVILRAANSTIRPTQGGLTQQQESVHFEYYIHLNGQKLAVLQASVCRGSGSRLPSICLPVVGGLRWKDRYIASPSVIQRRERA